MLNPNHASLLTMELSVDASFSATTMLDGLALWLEFAGTVCVTTFFIEVHTDLNFAKIVATNQVAIWASTVDEQAIECSQT